MSSLFRAVLGRRRRGGNSQRIFARLKPGVSIERAQADISAIAARLEQQFPGTNRNVKVMSLKEKVVGNTRVALVVLLVAVGFVLLIACANVAHMLLARAAARQILPRARLTAGPQQVVGNTSAQAIVVRAIELRPNREPLLLEAHRCRPHECLLVGLASRKTLATASASSVGIRTCFMTPPSSPPRSSSVMYVLPHAPFAPVQG